MTLAGYRRMSDARDEEKLGLGRQTDDITTLGARLYPNEPIAWYEDDDLSAWDPTVVRPDFERLLADITKGAVTGILTYNLDRFLRQPIELERVIKVCDAAGATKVHSVEGDLDLSTTEGQMTARILVAVTKKQSDDTSRRTRRKHEELRQNGQHSGRIPYGFTKTMTHDPVTSAAVRQMAAWCLEGLSTAEIGRRASLPTHAVRTILRNPSTYGLHPRTKLKAAWEGILSIEQRATVLAALARPAKPPTVRPRWLLGLAYCATCDRRLVSAGSTTKRRGNTFQYHYYGCPTGEGGCGLQVTCNQLEERVRGWLFKAAKDARPNQTEEITHAMAEIAQQEIILAEFAEDRRLNLMERSAYIQVRDTGMREIARLRGIVANAKVLDDVDSDLSFIAERWDGFTATKKRVVAGYLLDRVDVWPGVRAEGADRRRLPPAIIKERERQVAAASTPPAPSS